MYCTALAQVTINELVHDLDVPVSLGTKAFSYDSYTQVSVESRAMLNLQMSTLLQMATGCEDSQPQKVADHDI